MTVDLDRPQALATKPSAAWWKGAVIYQIYLRSFADSNGDGIGDLKGATGRLDHIAALGCDAIWISPFFTSPMKDFGYDVADHKGVDPIFGTLEDFDALIARAHALGLKVMIDQVYSHSSDEHRWFQESRSSRDNDKADWYVWADPLPDGSPPNNWQSVFGGPSWTWDARREQYYLHNFLAEQPDLNVRHPAVQDALLDVAKFWLDRGVDGFRLDALNFAMHDPALTNNPAVEQPGKRTRPFDFQHHLHNQSHDDIPAFIERVRALIERYDERFALAEVGGEQAGHEMKLYTAGDARLHSAYGFDYLYAEALTPEVVRHAVGNWPGGAGEGWPSWAFSNHDAPRFASRWCNGADRKGFVQLALMLLMSLRGTVILYQGEELGLPQAHVPYEHLRDPEALANWPQTLGRDGARTPLPWTSERNAGFGSERPWLPIDPAHLPFSVAAQEAEAGSLLNWTRQMIALRHGSEALQTGVLRLLDTSSDQLVLFEREENGERLRCAFNLSDRDARCEPFNGGRMLAQCGGADPASHMLPPFSGYIVRC